MDANFVGGYWGARAESRASCAAKIAIFLEGLTEDSIAFTHWFKRGKSLLSQPLELSPASILALLKTNNRDIGGEAISELGFSFSIWGESATHLRASLAVNCGSVHPRIGNYIAVSFDSLKVPKDLLRATLRQAVLTFDPDQAVVTSSEALSKVAPSPAWDAPSLVRYTRSAGFVE